MDEHDLADALAAMTGASATARAAVTAVVDVITHEVAVGGRVALPGFGVFDAVERAGVRRPRFRPGSGFRRAVAEEGSPPLSFSRFTVTPGVSLSAVLPAETSRCGIYVLHFHEGSVYVGQTRDLLGRFSRHVRHWGREGFVIVEVDFAPAQPEQLDELEVRTLQWFETAGKRLLNRALVGLPAGDNPLDLVVDRVAQERWLVGDEGDLDLTERVALAASRRQDGSRFRSLKARDDYPGIRLALFMYVVQVLPLPQETERRFWVITALPSTKRPASQRRLVTLSVNNVETLVLAEIKEEDGAWSTGGFLNTAPGDAIERGHLRRRRSYRTVSEVDAVYFVGWEGLFSLLQDPPVVSAARRLALGLMRKGTGMMGRFHDQSLADDVFLVDTAL